MFVARFCDQLDVQIKCDGCGTMLPGQRYRCLVCEDMDFCYPCYIGECDCCSVEIVTSVIVLQGQWYRYLVCKDVDFML